MVGSNGSLGHKLLPNKIKQYWIVKIFHQKGSCVSKGYKLLPNKIKYLLILQIVTKNKKIRASNSSLIVIKWLHYVQNCSNCISILPIVYLLTLYTSYPTSYANPWLVSNQRKASPQEIFNLLHSVLVFLCASMF